MIQPKQLEKFGLNGKQAQIYLACLELGTTSVQQISKSTGIKRTSVYDILENLINQGLITKTFRGKKKMFMAEDPEILKQNIVQKEKEFNLLLPELKQVKSATGTKPKIKFYEGVEGIKSVLEDTLTSQDKELKSILPMKDFIELVGAEYFDDYTNRRIKAGYSLRNIRPHSKELEKEIKLYKWNMDLKQRREVRIAPKNANFSMALYLYGNKVALLSSKKENFGMIIESEEFANNQNTLFEILWKASKIKK